MVIDAAHHRVAEEGLEALSMRGLGKDLHVEAMSLYKHVGRRENLVALLRQDLFSSIELPPRVRSARRDLEGLCHALFRGLNLRKGAQLLLPLRPSSVDDEVPESGMGLSGGADHGTAPWLPVLERMLGPLREMIPEPLDRAYAAHALLSFVLGQVVFAGRADSALGHRLPDAPGLEERFSEVLMILPALRKRSPEVEFELGLRALLDSIEGRRGF